MGGAVGGPEAQSAASVRDSPRPSLRPFNSVQESSSAPLEMNYTTIRTNPNQRWSRSPSPLETAQEICCLSLLTLHSIETILHPDHIRDGPMRDGPVNIFLNPNRDGPGLIYLPDSG